MVWVSPNMTIRALVRGRARRSKEKTGEETMEAKVREMQKGP